MGKAGGEWSAGQPTDGRYCWWPEGLVGDVMAIEEEAAEEFGDAIAEGGSAKRAAEGLKRLHGGAVGLWVVRVGERCADEVSADLGEVGDGAATVAAGNDGPGGGVG